MIVLGIFIGLVIGILSTLLIGYLISKKPTKMKILRRGIYTNEYVNKSDGSTFSVQFEIGEVERTESKSKVTVLSTVFSDTRYMSDESGIRKMVENSWIKSSEIEWIKKTTQQERNEKINEVLK